ncbi:MAG TPA: hypothetical protein VGJ81_18725 [Thermoanaerobaculia bacterium]|jgi:hypothetical protein
MRVLGAFSHGVIDYLMVILLAVGPGVAGFTNHRLAMMCYGLAAVHFLLTVITRFPLGVAKALPFWLHGTVEIVVAVLLVILPWLAHFSAGVLARNFFVAIGLLIALIFLLTDYRSGDRARAASTPKR